MRFFSRALLFLLPALLVLSPGAYTPRLALADMKSDSYWQVDDVRPGMKGIGRTVMKGTKIEEFDAEILGVMRNVSPGRDMILARLSGLGLEKTGVIAGMSGSPVYIDGKLLGAVAYAWQYGKEPIAGITPFAQMYQYVATYEHRDQLEKTAVKHVGLASPIEAGGRRYSSVAVSPNAPTATAGGADDSLWMVPLRTPLAASGMSSGSLAFLQDTLPDMGLTPVQGGAVAGNIPVEELNAPMAPGGVLSIALITGDFDLSGIGTVTHVDGKRVYGFGHPMMGLGDCEFPLMTGYVHTIFPRQTLSFKMGSPVRTVGVINADVSTAVAGWLDRVPDMLPVHMSLTREVGGPAKTFNVEVVRQRSLVSSLVQTALVNSIDMEGDLPEEMTVHFKARVDVEGHKPFVLDDVYSGSNVAGARAPQVIFNQVGLLLNQLTFNNIDAVNIKSVDCATEIEPSRRTAEIESIELDSDIFAPGETLKATVIVKPYKAVRERLQVSLPLPADLPEGTYMGAVSDDLALARQQLREDPNVVAPTNRQQLFAALDIISSVKRTNLVVYVPNGATGVAMNGKTLPDLPGSMVQILAGARRTGVQPVTSSLVARQNTAWVIQGADSFRFQVKKNKGTD